MAGHTVRVVAAVLLAAGSGSRFDGDTHKLLAPLRGATVLAHALAALRASGLPTFVVTGAVDLRDEVGDDVTLVHNDRWADGQAVSVRVGIAAAESAGHDAIVVGLGDQPFVTAAAWTAVSSSTAPIAVATYDGRRGHPVRLDSSVWDLLPSAGDEVGRALMRSRPDLVQPIPCAGDSTDIDTLEDLHRWT